MTTWTVFLLASAAFAQPSFDVASVKPSPPAEDLYVANLGTIRPGEVTLANATLADCVKFAYGLVSDEQVGGPDWVKSKGVRFDIVAKAPASTPREQLLLMLRTLLTQRFHLAFHTEQKPLSHLVLEVAKGGPKMQEVQLDPSVERKPAMYGHIVHPQISMYTLALLLSRQMRTLVLDRTGLKGVYSIDLQWTPEDAKADTGPSIYTALQQQLGLRLQGSKDPIDVMVIDRADRVPVEN